MDDSFAPRQPSPGYEIWFAVAIDPDARRGLWVRVTTLRPRADALLASAVAWGALFSRDGVRCGAAAVPLEAATMAPDGVVHPAASISPGGARGRLDALDWDVSFEPAFGPVDYVPGFLRRSPAVRLLRSRSKVCAPFCRVTGHAAGVAFGPNTCGVVTHIWGTQRVERLSWLFVPQFDGVGSELGLELVSLKLKPFLPRMTVVTLRHRDRLLHDEAPRALLSGRVDLSYPAMRIRAGGSRWAVDLEARLEAPLTAAYVYRDTDGRPFYVDHSDLGTVAGTVTLNGRREVVRCDGAAAVEFHGPHRWSAGAPLDPYRSLK